MLLSPPLKGKCQVYLLSVLEAPSTAVSYPGFPALDLLSFLPLPLAGSYLTSCTRASGT